VEKENGTRERERVSGERYGVVWCWRLEKDILVDVYA